jgi:prepilin-type N-terminal cleavage/methylation domain-containing protein
MKRTLQNSRRGFTLIELLVVMSLIIVLASLALAISPRVIEDQRTVRGADLTSGWLLVAKQRAVRDQQARGVRLVVSPDLLNGGSNTLAKEMVYIERPIDYRGGRLISPPSAAIPGYSDPNFPYPTAMVFVAGKDLTNGGPPNEPIVAPGDFLVFDTLETIPYNSHRVWNVIAVAGGTVVELAAIPIPPLFPLPQPSVVNGGNPISGMLSTSFRFVRQARPMAGEPKLQLPRDIAVDLNQNIAPAGSAGGGGGPSFLQGVANGAADGLDIMFSPSGQITGSNGISGKVILRIRNSSRPSTDGDQLYVVVYTRSGLIATHPVNMTVNPATGALLLPYQFLLDGNSSGF